MSRDNCIKHEDVKRPEIEIEGSIKKAQTSAIRTHRGDNKHQALVCLVCDRLIIGTETIHLFSKEWFLMHQHRLNVKAYQDFNNGETLNPILVHQYSVDDIPGFLLSPWSCKLDNDHFECCSECCNSLKPSKKDTTGPPKHAIANGFAINHLPLELKIEG